MTIEMEALLIINAAARDYIAARSEYRANDLYVKECFRRLKKAVEENPE